MLALANDFKIILVRFVFTWLFLSFWWYIEIFQYSSIKFTATEKHFFVFHLFFSFFAFFISNTFISKPGWHWQKIMQMLSNTLGLNFCYLKKIIGHILKNKQIGKRTSVSVFIRLIIMKMKMKMKNRLHRYDKIDLGLDMGTNIVNIKIVSVWWRLSLLSIMSATSEAQFMKKLSNTKAELKKALLLKKTCN